jgi:hypothetical protein
MTNLGVAPLDPFSDVGTLRATIGDTEYREVEPGIGDYEWFSDLTLRRFLELGSHSVLRAAGLAIKQLSLFAGLTGATVKTDDLASDTAKRGATLLDIAESLIKDADAADARSNEGGFALITPVLPSERRGRRTIRPQSAPAPSQGLTFFPDPQNPGYLRA